MSDRPTLLPASATALERVVEQVGAQIEDVPVSIKALWSPSDCPLPLLPYLASALSVDEWRESWSEHTKRRYVARSAETHRLKGTVAAVRGVLSSLGVVAKVEEWREFGGAPHSFRITALVNEQRTEGPTLGPVLYGDVMRLVAHAGPARSVPSIRIDVQTNSELGIAARVASAQCVRRGTVTPAVTSVISSSLRAACRFNAASAVRFSLEAA